MGAFDFLDSNNPANLPGLSAGAAFLSGGGIGGGLMALLKGRQAQKDQSAYSKLLESLGPVPAAAGGFQPPQAPSAPIGSQNPAANNPMGGGLASGASPSPFGGGDILGTLKMLPPGVGMPLILDVLKSRMEGPKPMTAYEAAQIEATKQQQQQARQGAEAIGGNIATGNIGSIDSLNLPPALREALRGAVLNGGKEGMQTYGNTLQALATPDFGESNGAIWDKRSGTFTGTVLPERPTPNQPFNPDGSPNINYQDYARGLRLAGRPQTNINMGQEGAFQREVGTEQGKRYGAITKGADDARSRINMLDALTGSLSKSPYRGPLADVLTDATRLGNQLGLDLNDTGMAETARAVSNQFALMLRNPAGGAGMPGALSDSDRKFLAQSVPSLASSPNGGAQLTAILKRMAQRQIEVSSFASQYVKQHGKLDEDFETELQRWSDQNPLFPSASGGNGGGGSSSDPLGLRR